MRIAKEWNLKRYKCTLMIHEMKYTLQIEDERLQLTYKMGDRPAEFIADIEDTIASPEIYQHIQMSFGKLYDTSFLIDKSLEIGEDDLPELM